MKVTVKTIIAAAVPVLLLAQVQAAELESGFLGMKWATPAKDLKGFTRVGGSQKIAYYVNPQRKYTFLPLLLAHRQAGQRGNEKESGG